MAHVFVLQHVYEETDGTDEVKFIGVYSRHELAEAAIARLRILPGFRQHPEGFHIDRYELDVDHWSSGFGSD